MICANINTKIRFNYQFLEEGKIVEIWDGEDYSKKISYDDWNKDYCIVDKFRCLSLEEIKFNKELWDKYTLET